MVSDTYIVPGKRKLILDNAKNCLQHIEHKPHIYKATYQKLKPIHSNGVELFWAKIVYCSILWKSVVWRNRKLIWVSNKNRLQCLSHLYRVTYLIWKIPSKQRIIEKFLDGMTDTKMDKVIPIFQYTTHVEVCLVLWLILDGAQIC